MLNSSLFTGDFIHPKGGERTGFLPSTDYQHESLGILAHLLRMVMEPKYLAEKVIIYPNHHLTR